MTPPFPARREAEEFASVIDGPSQPHVSDRYAELTRTVALLRTQTQPTPSPEFSSTLRERLMVVADVALLPAAAAGRTRSSAPRSRTWRERHLGAAVAALVMVGSTAGMAVAAEGSLPGQALYPVKRGIEHVELKMSTSDAGRGKEMLHQAATRLKEVQSLSQGPDDARSAALIKTTLNDFTSSADQGSSLLFNTYQGQGNGTDIDTVRTFTATTMTTLQSLAHLSPSNAATSFTRAGQTLADIDQQARVLCGGCSDAPPVAVPHGLISMSSISALAALISAPVLQAQHGGTLAAATQAEADAAQSSADQAGTGSPTTTTAQPDGATPPTSSASDAGNGAHGPGTTGSLPTLPPQPVSELLTGLTTKVPVLGQLGQILEGVTDPLGHLLGGLAKAPSPTATPTGK